MLGGGLPLNLCSLGGRFYVLGEIGPVAGVSCKFDDFVKGNLVKVPGVEDQGS